MPITIKELFKSDLDPNSNAWWSQDKIDKINFNFNQLSSGGMKGPMGSQGPNGTPGPKGLLGDQGLKGSQGFEGTQGPAGTDGWIGIDGVTADARFLYPKQPTTTIEYTPPVFGIGYLDTEQTPFPINGSADPRKPSVLNLKSVANTASGTDYRVNLKLTHDGNYSEHRYFKDGLVDVYELGKIRSGASGFVNRIKLNPNDTYKIYSQIGSVWKPTFNLSNLELTIKEIDGRFNKDTEVTKNVIFNGADVNDILVATDNTGKVSWQNPLMVLPGFKYGTIISIPTYMFTSSNFDVDGTYYNGGNPIRFKFGQGKPGTAFENWYLCNGQAWNTSAGINETIVPNLNFVQVNIDPFDNQVQVSLSNNKSIMGGHPTSMIAGHQGGGNYATSFNHIVLDNDDDTHNIILKADDPVIDTKIDLTQSIYLVKLDRNDLQWEQSTAVPPPIFNIDLTGAFDDQTLACFNPNTTTYSWDAPVGTDWTTFDDNTTDYKLYYQGTYNYAPTGYYESGGVTRYWSQSTGIMTNDQVCPTLSVVYLYFNDAVQGVNLGALSAIPMRLDSADLETATILLNQSSNTYASPGWYGTTGYSTNRKRRYWDGTQFLGDTLIGNYAYHISIANGSKIIHISNSTSTVSACSNYGNPQYEHEIFMMIDSLPSPGPQDFSDIATSPSTAGRKIYANLDWTPSTTSTIGEEPLVLIKSQVFPNATDSSVVNYLVEGDGTNSDTLLSINSDSTAGNSSICTTIAPPGPTGTPLSPSGIYNNNI